MKVKPKFKKNKHTRTNLLNNKYLQKKYLIIVGVIFVLVAAVLFASTRVTGKGALAYDACSAVGGTYKSACGEGEIENTSVTDASSASSSDSSPSTPGSNTPGSKTPGSSAIVIKTPTKIANKCCVPECIYNGGACALACADEEVDLTGPGHSCKNNAYSMASFKCCAPADAGPEELPDCESIPGQECVLFPFCAKDNKISDYNCGFLQTCCAVEQEGPACGNMHLDPGEECDDGNLNDDDGCDSNCNYWSPITPESTCPGDKTGDVVRENEQKNCMGILTTHSKTMMGGNLDTDTYVCCVQTCYFYAEREDTFGADCLEAVFDPETGPACAEGYLRDPVGSRTGSEPFCLQPEPPLLDTYLACCERDPCYDHGGFFPVDEPCEATPGHREILVEALNELPCCIPDIPCPTDEDCWCAPDNLANIAFVRANEYSCDSPLAVCWCPPDVNADAGPTCTDTDSEETDPYSVKGTATYTAAITGVETIADDVCASVIDATEASNKLIEYYCDADNNGQSKEITCSSDCQDGACVDEAPLCDGEVRQIGDEYVHSCIVGDVCAEAEGYPRYCSAHLSDLTCRCQTREDTCSNICVMRGKIYNGYRVPDTEGAYKSCQSNINTDYPWEDIICCCNETEEPELTEYHLKPEDSLEINDATITIENVASDTQADLFIDGVETRVEEGDTFDANGVTVTIGDISNVDGNIFVTLLTPTGTSVTYITAAISCEKFYTCPDNTTIPECKYIESYDVDGNVVGAGCACTENPASLCDKEDNTTNITIPVAQPTCGDGIINQDDEMCDLEDMGGLTCTNISEGSTGTLRCDEECHPIKSGCANVDKVVKTVISDSSWGGRGGGATSGGFGSATQDENLTPTTPDVKVKEKEAKAAMAYTPPATAEKEGRGALFWIILSVTTVVLLAGGFFALWFFYLKPKGILAGGDEGYVKVASPPSQPPAS